MPTKVTELFVVWGCDPLAKGNAQKAEVIGLKVPKTPNQLTPQGTLLVVCIWRHQKHCCANYDQFAPNFDRLKLQLHDAIYRLRFYSYLLTYILSLSNSHNNVASVQKNLGDKSHRAIVALWDHTGCRGTKVEVVWMNENRVMGQRSWRTFYYVAWESGLVGILCPPTWLPQYRELLNFEQL